MTVRHSVCKLNLGIAAAALPLVAGMSGAGMASAAPSVPAAVTTQVVRGVDHGVGYAARPTVDRSAVVTTLDAGTFRLSADGDTVSVTDGAGATIATLPTTLHVAGATIPLLPRIDRTRRILTLTPVDAVQQDLGHPTVNEVIGAVGGGVIGATIGAVLGGLFLIFDPITVPLGLIIGGGVGGYNGFNWGAGLDKPLIPGGPR